MQSLASFSPFGCRMSMSLSVENFVAAFERNAFRALSLPADTEAKEIYRRQQRIQNALELGDDSVAAGFAFLPKTPLGSEEILDAIHRVERQRALEELFWVHQVGGKFEFSSGTVDTILANLRADAGQNTTKGSVAQHNLAVILTCLAQGLDGSRRLDYWRDAIHYWDATLANNVFWQFMEDREELTNGNGESPSSDDLRDIAREAIERAIQNQIWTAVNNRDYDETASLLILVREYNQVFDVDSMLNAVGDRMAADGSVAIGGILDRVAALSDGVDEKVAKSELDSARQDLHRIGDEFEAIIQAFGATDAFADLYDARALALKKLSVAYFNLVSDEQAALQLVIEAGTLARDTQLKGEIEAGWTHIRRSLACSEAIALIEQKNYAAALESLSVAMALSTEEQKAEIVELQQGVRYARLTHDLDTTQRHPSLRTINGIGARFYGRSDFDAETNSYITVHWFVFFYLPIIPMGRYRISNLGRNRYTIYGRSPLSPALRNYRWLALAAIALMVVWFIIASGNSSGSTESSYTPPSVSSQSAASSSVGDSQSSEKAAIEAQRAELEQMKASLDLRQRRLGQERAKLDDMKSYIRSVDTTYTPDEIPDDVLQKYKATVAEFNRRRIPFNAELNALKQDDQRYEERVAAFNQRVDRYNANQ